MRIVLAATLSLSLAGSLPAQTEPAAKAPPPGPAPSAVVPPVPVDPGKFAGAAAAWFPSLAQNLEVPVGATEAKGVFAFANPRDRRIDWQQLAASCSCSRASVLVGERRYELQSKQKQLVLVTGQPGAEQRQVVDAIPIGPGERGQVEVHLDPNGLQGPKLVYLDIHTTDAEVPMVRLQLHAIVQQAITVLPAAVDLGTVPSGEAREFSVQVRSIHQDFAITGAAPFPAGITATWERQQQGDQVCWVIRGSLRQENLGDTHATLEFQTNIDKAPSFPLKVHAAVRRLVEMTPGFLAVGVVRKGHAKSARVTFTAVDGRNLEVVALRCEKLSLPEKFVALRASKDGPKVVVEVEVAADAPLGLLRGDVVVDFDQPAAGQQRVLFNGFVR